MNQGYERVLSVAVFFVVVGFCLFVCLFFLVFWVFCLFVFLFWLTGPAPEQ